jgi:lipid-binding SYLF domain-containing protein
MYFRCLPGPVYPWPECGGNIICASPPSLLMENILTILFSSFRKVLILAGAVLSISVVTPVQASSDHLNQDVDAALKALYDTTPAAKALGENAKGILVFPNITKAGFIVGGLGGDGALIQNGKKVGYYNNAAASFGLQAGIQTYGFALFFMSDKVMKDFLKSKGWEIGVGPTVVVVDSGAGKDLNTLTGKADVYAFIFDQKGLMAGVGIQGSKITKLKAAR